MTNQFKTGLCTAALVLALLAAFVQEASYQGETVPPDRVQPVPFSYLAPGR